VAGLFTNATSESAVGRLFARIDDTEDIISQVVTKVTGDSTEATVATKLNEFTAGLINTANLEEATARIISNN
jgi:hypothetical protein